MAELPPDFGCWARKDDAPPFEALTDEDGIIWTEHGWGWSCGKTPADDLGLCPHHRATIVGRPVAVGAPAQIRPTTRASILAWPERNAGGGSP